MPSMYEPSYESRRADIKRREAKMRAKGILEGSSKWNTLLFRRGF